MRFFRSRKRSVPESSAVQWPDSPPAEVNVSAVKKNFERFLDTVDRGDQKWQKNRNSGWAAYHYKQALKECDELEYRMVAMAEAAADWLKRYKNRQPYPEEAPEWAHYSACLRIQPLWSSLAGEARRRRGHAESKIQDYKQTKRKRVTHGNPGAVVSQDTASNCLAMTLPQGVSQGLRQSPRGLSHPRGCPMMRDALVIQR
jgi:hypothetical protein